jgi:hypothetical protein
MTGLATTMAAGNGAPGDAPADVAVAEATPADANPYSVIGDRNIFHLNPPPIPPTNENVIPLELPKLMLTGITKRGDSWKVWLAIPPKDSKETVVYLTLAPGEKEHDVELVKVRYDKEEVDIVNAGTPQTLSVKSNSYASAAPPPARVERGGTQGLIPGFGGHKGGGGFGPSRNTMPIPPGRSADITPRGSSAIIAGGGGGGSAIISGGGGGNANSLFGGSSGNAIVSGGSPYVSTGATALANTAGEQIATSLLNQQNGHYQPPTPTAPAVPIPVQAVQMLAQKQAWGGGGPPLPPNLQSMLEENAGQPPGPP